jgi:hypothetical protein
MYFVFIFIFCGIMMGLDNYNLKNSYNSISALPENGGQDSEEEKQGLGPCFWIWSKGVVRKRHALPEQIIQGIRNQEVDENEVRMLYSR